MGRNGSKVAFKVMHALFIKVIWGCLSRILLTYCVELLLLRAQARVGKGGGLLLFPRLHVRSQVCWKAV